MNFKIIGLLLIFSPALIWAGESMDKKIAALLKKEYTEKYKSTDSTFQLSKDNVKTIEQKSRIKIHYNDFRLFKILMNDSTVAKALIAKVSSKTGNISVLTLINNDGTIRTVKVVGAEDPRSFNLNSKLWRKQFKGKSMDNYLRVGKDIDAMSGATISSNAATKAVKISLHINANIK